MAERSLLERANICLDNHALIGERSADPDKALQMAATGFKPLSAQQAYDSHAQALAAVASAQALERIAARLDTITLLLERP